MENKVDDEGVGVAYVCGMDADACVSKVCHDLFDADIRPVVLSDCVASSDGRAFVDMALATFGGVPIPSSVT